MYIVEIYFQVLIKGDEYMHFDKYVAAGNDFLIFNNLEGGIRDYRNLALKACHRQFGIGADGILTCERSDLADVKMIYYNSDGSQGEMCGNGIRSFAKYVYDYGIIEKQNFTVETLARIQDIKIKTDKRNKIQGIKINIGCPIFKASKIPVNIDKDEIINEEILISGKNYRFSSVLVGVPHTVIFVNNIDNININDLGRKIENHPIFPKKTNVNFVEVIDPNNINIYTWERGAGRTLGCGTGSASSVVIGNKLGKLGRYVNINTEGGSLRIGLEDNGEIKMIGRASHIAKGVLLI